MTSERMTARGMFRFGSFVSAASAIQLSKPTRIRIARVDWINTPCKECGQMTSRPPLNPHCVACSGLPSR